MAVLKYYVEGKGYIDLGANEVARFKQLYPNAQRVTPEPQAKPEQPKQSGKSLMYDVLLKETDPLKRVEATLMSEKQLSERQTLLGEAKKAAEPSLAKMKTPAKAGYEKGQAVARKLDNWEDALTINSDSPVANFVNQFTGAMTDTIAVLATSVASVPGLSVTSPVLEMIGNPYGSQMIKGMVDKAYELHGFGGEDMDMMGALGSMDLPKAAGIGFKAFVQSAPQTAAWVMNPYLGMATSFATSGTGKYLDMEREHPELGKGASIESAVVVGTMEALSEHIGNVFGIGKALKLGKNLPEATMKKVLKSEISKRTYLGMAKNWGAQAGIEGIEEVPNFVAEYLMDIHNGIAEWNPQVFRDGILNAGLLGAAAGGWQGGITSGRNALLYNRYLNIESKLQKAANTDVTQIRDIEKRNIAANLKTYAQQTIAAAEAARGGDTELANSLADETIVAINRMRESGKYNKTFDTIGLYNSLIKDSITQAEEITGIEQPVVEQKIEKPEIAEPSPSEGIKDTVLSALESKTPEAIEEALTAVNDALLEADGAEKERLSAWRSSLIKSKPKAAKPAEPAKAVKPEEANGYWNKEQSGSLINARQLQMRNDSDNDPNAGKEEKELKELGEQAFWERTRDKVDEIEKSISLHRDVIEHGKIGLDEATERIWVNYVSNPNSPLRYMNLAEKSALNKLIRDKLTGKTNVKLSEFLGKNSEGAIKPEVKAVKPVAEVKAEEVKPEPKPIKPAKPKAEAKKYYKSYSDKESSSGVKMKEMVNAKPVTPEQLDYPEMDLFITRENDDETDSKKKGGWVISTNLTGGKIASGKTLKEALSNAREKLEKGKKDSGAKTNQELADKVVEHHKKMIADNEEEYAKNKETERLTYVYEGVHGKLSIEEEVEKHLAAAAELEKARADGYKYYGLYKGDHRQLSIDKGIKDHKFSAKVIAEPDKFKKDVMSWVEYHDMESLKKNLKSYEENLANPDYYKTRPKEEIQAEIRAIKEAIKQKGGEKAKPKAKAKPEVKAEADEYAQEAKEISDLENRAAKLVYDNGKPIEKPQNITDNEWDKLWGLADGLTGKRYYGSTVSHEEQKKQNIKIDKWLTGIEKRMQPAPATPEPTPKPKAEAKPKAKAKPVAPQPAAEPAKPIKKEPFEDVQGEIVKHGSGSVEAILNIVDGTTNFYLAEVANADSRGRRTRSFNTQKEAIEWIDAVDAEQKPPAQAEKGKPAAEPEAPYIPNGLNKKHPYALFKGETWKALLDYVPTYFLPNFNKPLKITSTSNVLMSDDNFVRTYGEDNLDQFIADAKKYDKAEVSITVKDDDRVFNAKVPQFAVSYLIDILSKTTPSTPKITDRQSFQAQWRASQPKLTPEQLDAQLEIVDAFMNTFAKEMNMTLDEAYAIVEQIGTEELKDALNQVDAFHGSGAFFDRFDVKFMGTGEGRQAFGWGIYVTERKGVAADYAKKIGRTVRKISINGEEINGIIGMSAWHRMINEATKDISYPEKHQDTANLANSIFIYVKGKEHDILNAINTLTQLKEIIRKDFPHRHALWESVISMLKDIVVVEEKGHNLYQVSVWENRTEDVLEWYGEITKEQENKIIAQANAENIDIVMQHVDAGVEEARMYLTDEQWKELETEELSEEYLPFQSGEELYKAIIREGYTPQEASEFLLRAGIDGIKTPVNALSGGKGEKGYNYVVFDANAIGIKEHVLFQDLAAQVKFRADNKIDLAFISPDITSGMHEMAHIGRRMMAVMAQKSPKWQTLNKAAEDWSGANNGEWSTEAEEKFANGFLKYLHEGTAPNSKLKTVFEKIKQWFSETISRLRDFAGLTLNQDIIGVYDALLGKQPLTSKQKVGAVKVKAALSGKSVNDPAKLQTEMDKLANQKGLVLQAKKTGASVAMYLIDVDKGNTIIEIHHKNGEYEVNGFHAEDNADAMEKVNELLASTVLNQMDAEVLNQFKVKDALEAERKRNNESAKLYKRIRLRLKEEQQRITNWNNVLTLAINRAIRIKDSRAIPFDEVKAQMLLDFDLMPPTEAELKKVSSLDGEKQMAQLLKLRQAKIRRMEKNDIRYRNELEKATGFRDISKVPTIRMFSALEKMNPVAYETFASEGYIKLLRDTIPELAKLPMFEGVAYSDLFLSQISEIIVEGEATKGNIGEKAALILQAHRMIIRLTGKAGVKMLHKANKGNITHAAITHAVADTLKRMHDILNTNHNHRKVRYTGEELNKMRDVIYTIEDDKEIKDKREAIIAEIKAKHPAINYLDVAEAYDSAKELTEYFRILIIQYNADPKHKRKIGIQEDYLPRFYDMKDVFDITAPSQGYLHWPSSTKKRTAEKADITKIDNNLYNIMRRYSYQMAKVLSYADLADYVEPRRKLVGYNTNKQGEQEPIYKEYMSEFDEDVDIALHKAAAKHKKYIEQYVRDIIGYMKPKDVLDKAITNVKNAAYTSLLTANIRLTLQNYMQKQLVYAAVDTDVANMVFKNVNWLTGTLRHSEKYPLFSSMMRGYVIQNTNLIAESQADAKYIAETSTSKIGKTAADMFYLYSKWLSASPFAKAEFGNRGMGHAAGALQVIMRSPEYLQAKASGRSWAESVETALQNPAIYEAAELNGGAINAEINADSDPTFAPALYREGTAKWLTLIRYMHTFLLLFSRVYKPKSSRSGFAEDLQRLNMSGQSKSIDKAELIRAAQIAARMTDPQQIRKLLDKGLVSGEKIDTRLSMADAARLHKYFNGMVKEYSQSSKKEFAGIATGGKGKAQRIAGLTGFVIQDAILNTLYGLLLSTLIPRDDDDDYDLFGEFFGNLLNATQLARLGGGINLFQAGLPNVRYANTPEKRAKAITDWFVRITPFTGIFNEFAKQTTGKSLTDRLWDILLD